MRIAIRFFLVWIYLHARRELEFISSILFVIIIINFTVHFDINTRGPFDFDISNWPIWKPTRFVFSWNSCLLRLGKLRFIFMSIFMLIKQKEKANDCIYQKFIVCIVYTGASMTNAINTLPNHNRLSPYYVCMLWLVKSVCCNSERNICVTVFISMTTNQ